MRAKKQFYQLQVIYFSVINQKASIENEIAERQ